MNPFFQDQLDDPILTAGTIAFAGVDQTLKPSLLPDTRVQEALNVLMDVDGLCQQRPGLRFVAFAGSENAPVRAMHYYDLAYRESILTARGATLYATYSDQHASGAVAVPGLTLLTGGAVRMAQLVDRVFCADGRVGLGWVRDTGSSYEVGTVTQSKQDNDLPVFVDVAVHGFRLFGIQADSDELRVSDLLEAADKENWSELNSIRVGDGDGDPIRAVRSFQEQQLMVFKEASVYVVDTTATNVADWSIRRVSHLTGCVAGRTAVQLGQDVLFLSRQGVMSLGALSQSNSVSAATSVSAGVRTALDRLNWAAVRNSWAVAWRQYYLLAVPLDGMTHPRTLLVLNTQTKEWVGTWMADLPAVAVGDDVGVDYPRQTGGWDAELLAWEGWSAGVVTRFGGRQETCIADTCGRVLCFDEGRWDDANDAQQSQPIHVRVTTRSWDFAMPQNIKQAFRLEVEFYEQQSPAMDISVVYDGRPAQAVATGVLVSGLTALPFTLPFSFVGTSILRRSWNLRPMPIRRFREMAVRFEQRTRGRFSLRRVALNAFADSGEVVQ